jgi:hypothetical protein
MILETPGRQTLDICPTDQIHVIICAHETARVPAASGPAVAEKRRSQAGLFAGSKGGMKWRCYLRA